MDRGFSVIDVAETIKRMELELGLLRDESYGREARLAWEASRHIVFIQCAKHLGLYEDAHTAEKKLSEMTLFYKIWIILNLVWNSILYNPFFARKNERFLFLVSPRRKRNSLGIWEDIYSECIISQLGATKINILERSYSNKHFRPTKERVYCTDFLMFIAYLYRRIFWTGVNDKASEITRDINQYLSQVFQTQFKFSEAFFFDRWMKNCANQRSYSLLLRWLRPEWVMLICGYDNQPLVLAAKALGIPVIELQHGVIGPFHLGYSVPEGEEKYSFPDYLFTFGDFWKNTVNYSVSDDRIISVGYPFLQQEKAKYQELKKKPQILFISQRTIGLDLARVAVDFARSNDSASMYKVIFKLHPGECLYWKTTYSELYEASKANLIEVVDSDLPGLYQLQAESGWQVGVYSTALFEGMAFNCKTLIVNLPGHEYMSELISAGLVKLIEPGQKIDLNSAPEIDERKLTGLFCENWEERLIKGLALVS